MDIEFKTVLLQNLYKVIESNFTIISANQKCTLGQTSNGNANLKYHHLRYHFENQHGMNSVQMDGCHVGDYFLAFYQYIDQEKFVLGIDHAK